MSGKKMMLILIIILIPIATITSNYFIEGKSENVYSSRTYGAMYIEEKGHHVEPG